MNKSEILKEYLIKHNLPFREIKLSMPSQESLADQLKKLIAIANDSGLYDTADYLIDKVNYMMRSDSTYNEQLVRSKLAVEKALAETDHISWNS